jgi:chromosome segregation ATPase
MKMDISIITELIATLGFPIALVIAMGFFIYKIYNQSVEREAALMEEIKINREVNAKAIDTIAHYAEKLEVIQGDISEIKTDLTKLAAKGE